jgi:hypothetical protein
MTLKKLALTIGAGCAIVSTASADSTLYIAGSTAYRKATYAALLALYNAAGNSLDANYPVGDSSSTATGSGATVNSVGNGAANLVWSGTLANQGLGHVVIVANWSGSISGQKADAESAVWPTFLDPATVAPAENFIGHIPDYNVSDNFQKTTVYTAALDPLAVNLTRTPVAVIEFVVAKDPTAPADLTDVTSEGLRELYLGGFINLAQFTGSAADTGSYVIGTGRDDDSGTRTIFEADNGLSFTATLLQWGLHSPSVDNSPAGTYTPYQFGLASINANDGTGYSSGGTVAKVLADGTGPGSILNPSTGVGNVTSYFVGYVSVTDANGVVAPAQWLNYNGVPFSNVAVEQGQYTYWGYENVDIRPAHKNGIFNTFYNALVTGLTAQAGTLAGTLPIANLAGSRTADGGLFSHN